jgi:hypothetical protein
MLGRWARNTIGKPKEATMFKNSALIGAILTWCGLLGLGCSDPIPPAPEAALSTTISQLPSGSCSNTRGPISVGEHSTELLAGSPGDSRIINGENGSVSCSVVPNGTGFDISADIDANALELNPSGIPYHQEFSLHATYPALTPHAAGATASISSTDTRVQTNRADGACALDVISLGDGTGGALFATFNCSNFVDSNTPDTTCRMTGTIVLENCAK